MPAAKTPAKSRRKGLQVQGDLQLTHAGAQFLGGKRIALLERIESERSITRAAKRAGLSYKGAWDAIDAMNNVSPRPLVTTSTGGRHGGGAELTVYGREVVGLYRSLEAGHRRVLAGLEHEMHDAERLGGLLQAIALKTSARNQFAGTVTRVRKGAVNAEVILDIGAGLEICASITNESVTELELAKGKPAYALIKASFVILTPDVEIRVSARNKLAGTVSAIVKGAVNSEIKLSLPGERTLTAIVTNESVKELKLKKGASCCALIKSSHVLLAVNR